MRNSASGSLRVWPHSYFQFSKAKPISPSPRHTTRHFRGRSCYAITATEAGLLLPGDRLDPAECLLDALADALADGIAAVPGRSPINRRTAAVGVLRNVRRQARWARLPTSSSRPSTRP